MKRKIFVMLAAVSVVSTLIVGCGSKEVSTPQEEENIVEEDEPAPEQEEESEIAIESEKTKDDEETETTEEPEEPAEAYTYTDLNQTMYAKQTVNVRSLPSTDGEKIGGLSKAQEVTVTGQCNETSWYRIDYNGSVGYVSNSYLVKEKPAAEVAQEPTKEPAKQPEAASYPDCPYTLFEATFDGTYFYFYHDCTHQGYFAGCTSASNILTDLVWNTDFAKDYPQGYYFGLDHDNAVATVIGDYKNISPNVTGDYMTVVYIKIPFKVEAP